MAGLIGAAIAPTDPAVTFSVLGGREIRGRSGTILEGEAGTNDPVGIALMIGMIELATDDEAGFGVVLEEFAVEMASRARRRHRRARCCSSRDAPRPAHEPAAVSRSACSQARA